jgi:energy-converting hydrogenase Eha subunit E
MGKTSLERSHSKLSNFKLTILALIAIISFNLIFVGLVLLKYNQQLSIIITIVGAVLSVLSFILIRAFVR